jgi:Protein phosphatase 2C
MRLHSHIWSPDNSKNADWYRFDGDVAVIIDGAANIGNSKIPGFENDAVWLVRRLGESLAQLSGKSDKSAIQIVEQIRLRMLEEYINFLGTVDEQPFACLGIVREIGDYCEFLNMGDLTFLIEMIDGNIVRFGDNTVRKLDKNAENILRKAIESSVGPHSRRMELVWDDILSNRSQRNKLQGYEVFDMNFCSLIAFERILRPKKDIKSVLMMTDGFYRCVDVYHLMSDKELFVQINRFGLSCILEKIRTIEKSDEDCVKYPRFKNMDDATALLINMEKD